MVVVLLGITAVTSSAVGLVYRVTEAPIAQAKLHKKADALAQVLPPFANTPADEMQAVAAAMIRCMSIRPGWDRLWPAMRWKVSLPVSAAQSG